jgi:hypothetical protein
VFVVSKSLPWRGHSFNNRGSDYMTQFTFAARNLFLSALVSLPLAACGGGSDGSSSAAVAQEAAPNAGMIDRSAGLEDTASAASVASNTTSTAPSTAATTPVSTGSNGSTSGGSSTSAGTVAKNPPPVATVDGVATLDWMPPTENSDGTALTNLAGYTVYYGTSADNLSQSVKVTNPGLTAYAVTGLTSGTWYFAVTSYSADGVESTRTNTVSTKI